MTNTKIESESRTLNWGDQVKILCNVTNEVVKMQYFGKGVPLTTDGRDCPEAVELARKHENIGYFGCSGCGDEHYLLI